MDFDPNVIKWEEDYLKCASCIGLTPIHPVGCMIVIWTEGVGKKFRTAAEICKEKAEKMDAKPGQYYLYIPKGVMVILPGNTIHAGGICF